VRCFHRLATFYRWFIKGFNTVIAPITDYLNKSEFAWSNTATKEFIEIKARMISVPVMRLPDFSKIFEVVCDASDIGIGGVLA